MMRKLLTVILWLLVAVMLWLLVAWRADAVEVIVNRSVPDTALSLANARAIFGMRQVKWSDGSLIRVFVLPDNHPLHGAFCKEKLNIYPYQLRQSWDRLVYSGMAQAPEEVANEAELVARVAATPGAIGYASRVPNHEKVRVLHVE
jgi:ABC-type phosphate transport system substrate-binding protein